VETRLYLLFAAILFFTVRSGGVVKTEPKTLLKLCAYHCRSVYSFLGKRSDFRKAFI